jgi:uncharacterized OB-fold protein
MEYKVGSLPPEGYIAWDEWAKAQEAGGLKQTQCPKCELWLFPQEMKVHHCTQPMYAGKKRKRG